MREGYTKRVKVSQKNRASRTKQQIPTIQSTVIIGDISVTCGTLICNKLGLIGDLQRSIKLMPGLSDDSVILLLPLKYYPSAYEPVEMVTQLDEYNLLDVDKYF